MEETSDDEIDFYWNSEIHYVEPEIGKSIIDLSKYEEISEILDEYPKLGYFIDKFILKKASKHFYKELIYICIISTKVHLTKNRSKFIYL